MGGASFIGCTIMLPGIICFIHKELKKMRIVAGAYRSRTIQPVPGNTTRPTTDKIKEAIFSRIGPYFDGGQMLDLFAGSGNMGLEAISRGMNEVWFCDSNVRAIQIIKANANSLGCEAQCHFMKADYRMMLKRMAQEQRCFSLIYLDPPYRKQRIDEILSFLSEHSLLAEEGSVIAESLREDEFSSQYGEITKCKEAIYGITKITYYKR